MTQTTQRTPFNSETATQEECREYLYQRAREERDAMRAERDALAAALRDVVGCFGDGPDSDDWWDVAHDTLGPAGDGMSSTQIRMTILERARAALAKVSAA